MLKQPYWKKPVRVQDSDFLIEVLVPAVVTWGLHNSIIWQDRVGVGFRFNTHSMVGSWHNVDPLTKRTPCFKRVGEALPADQVDAHNHSRSIKIKRIYDKHKSA